MRDSDTAKLEDGERSDSEYDALLQELERDKEQEALHRQEEQWDADFTVHLLGGRWQMERSGRLKYGLRFDLKSQTPLFLFAEKFVLPKSASFDHELYGESLGHLLGTIWMQRHRQLYEHWLEHESPDEFPFLSLPPLPLSDEQERTCNDLSGSRRRRANYYINLQPGDGRRS